jgi:tRNA A37 N6-isopentenylltransferase MiaA
MEMEENIEEIKRSLEVLNMRIDVTYEKLEERLIARVDEMVDKKMEKFKHEIKNEFKRSTQLRESKSQHENFKSKELRMGDFAEE